MASRLTLAKRALVLGSICGPLILTQLTATSLVLGLALFVVVSVGLFPIGIASLGIMAFLLSALLTAPCWTQPWTTALVLLLLNITFAVGFMLVRHLQLQRDSFARQKATAFVLKAGADGNRSEPLIPESSYIAVVLGSGGHTKEMLIMMERGFPRLERFHRRYLISSGDRMSSFHLEEFEEKLKSENDDRRLGSYDVHFVPRARNVHQPIVTAPLTSILSMAKVFPLLLLANPAQPGFDIPDVIITNGPATGFIVSLCAYILRLFCLVPDEKLRVLYVESWARVQSLSLTGKLFHYTGIADLFVVQHEPVAARYGLLNVGWLVLGARSKR